MHPARVGLLVSVAAEALERGERVLREGLPDLGVQSVVAKGDGREDRDERQYPDIECVWTWRLCQQQHQSLPDVSHRRYRCRQRKYDLSATRHGVEPGIERVRDAGVDEDRVERFVQRSRGVS